MATATEPPRDQRAARSRWIPVRACGRCETVDDVFHLTMVAETWLCRDCHARMHFGGARSNKSAEIEATRQLHDEHAPPRASAADVALARVDTTLRWLSIVGRFGAYALLTTLTASYPILGSVLIGFFVADVCGWAVGAWIDAHFHGYAVTAEAVLFSVLLAVLHTTGHLDLPVDPVGRYLAGGVAGLTLLGKIARIWRQLTVM